MSLLIDLAKSLPKPVKAPLRILWATWRRIQETPLESLPNTPDLFPIYRRLQSNPELTRVAGGWQYQSKFYPDYLTVGGASHAIFSVALGHCQGRGVDVGAGHWPLPGAIAVDLERGAGAGKRVADFADGTLDYVFSSHCLEHIASWRQELSQWLKKIKPGGTLFLYLPHPTCAIWHPGSPFVGDGHKWIPTPEIISQVLSDLGCEISARDDGPDVMQSFFVCAKNPLPAISIEN